MTTPSNPDVWDIHECWPTHTCRSWADIRTFYAEHEDDWRTWVFRGQGDSQWRLASRLERVLKNRFPWNTTPPAGLELHLLWEFKRPLYRYSVHLPDQADFLEWLSLMRHYGAPTRLVDWTYSFWVALFFAVETAELNQTSAVWAFDMVWWRTLAEEKVGSKIMDKFRKDPKSIKATRSVLYETRSCGL